MSQEHAPWCQKKTGEVTRNGRVLKVVGTRGTFGDPSRAVSFWPPCGCQISPTAKSLRRLKRAQEKQAKRIEKEGS